MVHLCQFRRSRQPTINDKFATLAEALYVAERKARAEVEMRLEVQKKLLLKEKEQQEVKLRELASKAREERAGLARPDGVGAGGAGAGRGDDDDDAEEVPAVCRLYHHCTRVPCLRTTAACCSRLHVCVDGLGRPGAAWRVRCRPGGSLAGL